MFDYDGHDPDYASDNTDLLPPELLLAPDSLQNDQYLRDIAAIKRLIVSQTSLMHRAHVEICKLAHVGQKREKIAESVDLTPATVSRVVNSPKGKKLRALLSHLSLMMEGPREAHRRNFLWRIAQRNEITDPRVAISALAELNRMTHQERLLEEGNNGGNGNVVQVVINNEHFPRGALD